MDFFFRDIVIDLLFRERDLEKMNKKNQLRVLFSVFWVFYDKKASVKLTLHQRNLKTIVKSPIKIKTLSRRVSKKNILLLNGKYLYQKRMLHYYRFISCNTCVNLVQNKSGKYFLRE